VRRELLARTRYATIHVMTMRARTLVAVVLLVLAVAPLAEATSSRDAAVRPGVGIGKLRLGMTLVDVRKALAQPLFVSQPTRVSRGARYLQYESDNGLWQVGLLGPRGRERLASISTQSRRERLRNVGVGTLVSTLPERLAPLSPKCVRGSAYINYNVIPSGIATCAITTKSVLTIFWGDPQCAVPQVRYQGCPEVRVPVGTITVEGPEVKRAGFSAWDPDPEPPPPTP